MENRDFDRAEKLKYHLLAIQRAEPAGETPAVTPYPAGATPKPENDVYRNGIADSTEDGSWVVRDVNNNEVKIPASISIDKLASMITSEDNQHFQEKQEEEQKKLREKLWWLYDGKDPDKEKKLCSSTRRNCRCSRTSRSAPIGPTTRRTDSCSLPRWRTPAPSTG